MALRLFIAVTPPEHVRERIARLTEGLKGVKSLPRAQVHLTLRFLGDVEAARVVPIDRALAGIESAPFELAVRGVGSFGRPPRVLWAGVEPEERVRELYERVEAALERAGEPSEKRSFSPHLTIARVKDSSPARIRSFLSEHEDFACESFVVTELRLYSSVLGSEGAKHTVLKTYPLGRG